MSADRGNEPAPPPPPAGTGVSHHTVSADDAGIRLDRWFHRHLPAVPHSLIQRWLRSGQVRVDGSRAGAAQRLAVGQVVRVPPHGDAEQASRRRGADADPREVEALRRAVLYRDEEIIVVNKPPGLAVQGGSGTRLHVDGLLDGLRFGGERPRLVHRLDRDTSGVLVLARSARVAAELAEAFRRHDIGKLYWAVVIGGPRSDEGRIDLPLAKVAGPHGDRVRATAAAGGDKAITDFRVIGRAGQMFSWLALSPQTGRTHQLRVHCATRGMPILGDGKYGLPFTPPPHLGLGRGLHLHARSLALPRSGRTPLIVTAPLPPHMAASFRALGFSEALVAGDADWPAAGPVARHARGLSRGRHDPKL